MASISIQSKNRGFLARLAVFSEVEEPPKDYSRRMKWCITIVVAAAGTSAPIGSAIIYPALSQVTAEFGCSGTTANLSVAFYMLSMSIFPLWWSHFSETFGRRAIYLISFSASLVSNILSARSSNVAMFIAMRILSGGAAASVQAVGAGTVADVWEVRERGTAMGIFYLGPLSGPLLAPVLGGLLAQRWGWRSTQWFQAAYAGMILVLITFCLPETLRRWREHPISGKQIRPDKESTTVTASATSASRRRQSLVLALKHAMIDPLRVLGLLRHPAILITVAYASITFGALYTLNISIQHTFSSHPYSYSAIIIGLLYLPNAIGYFLASVLGGRWTDFIMAREARAAGRYDSQGGLVYQPEDRMRENAWIAGIVYPAALCLYGWSSDSRFHLHWEVPILLGGFLFGVTSMLVFATSTTMLTEFVPQKSSSGVAVNNFVRNIVSCVGCIVAQPLIESLGNGWLFTGIALIAWTGASAIWALRKYGPRWRQQMREQPAES